MAEVTYAEGDHDNKKQKKIHDELVDKIETRESFWPINRQEVYKHIFQEKDNYDCPIANYIGENGLYLPSGPDISDHDIGRVIK